MRLTIDKENFLRALNDASRAIASRNPIAVLANFKIELNERGLEVTGSNNDITVRSFVPYEKFGKTIISNGVPGTTIINAHLLLDIVRQLEGGTISFDVIDDALAKIFDGQTNLKLVCARGDEYPDIDLDGSAGIEVVMTVSALSELVNQSAFAATTKEQLPMLTAVHLELMDGKMTATATDSARLARKTIPIDSPARIKTNIPARSLLEIIRLAEGSELIKMVVSDRKVLFFYDGNVVSSRLIPGDYPVSRNIVPSVCNYRLQVNSQEILSAMSRISILSADRESVVKLSMSEDHVEVSVRSDRHGSGSEAIKTFQYDGEPLEISFNSLFLIDAIKSLKSEDVTICFQAEMKPFVVKNPSDDSVVELITPMKTR